MKEMFVTATGLTDVMWEKSTRSHVQSELLFLSLSRLESEGADGGGEICSAICKLWWNA